MWWDDGGYDPWRDLAAADAGLLWSERATDLWNATNANGFSTIVSDLGTLDDCIKSSANWATNIDHMGHWSAAPAGYWVYENANALGSAIYGIPSVVNGLLGNYVESTSVSATTYDLAGPRVTAGKYVHMGLSSATMSGFPSRVTQMYCAGSVTGVISLIYWSATPTNTLSGEHGIYRVKLTYRTWRDIGYKTVDTTPIGTYHNLIELSEAGVVSTTTTSTFSFPINSFAVWYGAAASPIAAIGEIVGGSATQDGFVTPNPTTTNTTQTTTKMTVGAASATGGDTIYYVAVAPNPIGWAANPVPAFPGKGSQARYDLHEIYSTLHQIWITDIEVQDNFGATIETYKVNI